MQDVRAQTEQGMASQRGCPTWWSDPELGVIQKGHPVQVVRAQIGWGGHPGRGAQRRCSGPHKANRKPCGRTARHRASQPEEGSVRVGRSVAAEMGYIPGTCGMSKYIMDVKSQAPHSQRKKGSNTERKLE